MKVYLFFVIGCILGLTRKHMPKGGEMNRSVMLTPCMICRQTNALHNTEYRLRGIKQRLEVITKQAGKKEREEQEKCLKTNPWLKQMCETHIRCRYGMACTKMNHAVVRQLGKEVSMLLVLAKIMKANPYELCRLMAGYPKAANYILRGGI